MQPPRQKLSTCVICNPEANVTNVQSIESLRRGARGGCQFCRLLSHGVELLKLRMSNENFMLFLDWNYVVFNPQSYLDEYFSFALSSESTADSPYSQIPFEVTLVPKAGELLHFHGINSSKTR
jgi:hypothetical protein